MTTPIITAGTLGLLLALAGAAGAQAPAPNPAGGGLTFNAGIGGGWESSPEFVPSGEGSASGRGQASLSRTWSSPRSSLGVFASGQAQLYQLASIENRYSYGGGFNASTALGTRTTFGGGISADVGYTDQALDPTLAVLPLARTVSAKANVSLGRSLGTRSQMQLSGNYVRYDFDSANLTDGASLGGMARLSHRVSTKDSVALQYGLTSNTYDNPGDPSRLYHTIAAGYDRVLGLRSKFSLAAGVDFFSERGAATNTLYASGTYEVRSERSSLAASYYRGFSPGFGLGEDRLVNVFGLRAGTTLTRWLRVSLEGEHGLSQDPKDPTRSYTGDELSFAARASIGRSLGLVLSQAYRRRGESATTPSVADYRVGMLAEFTRVFR